MQTTIYIINRGINSPLEYRGLKASYIYYAAGMVIGGLLFFAITYVCGISVWVCFPCTILLASGGLARIYHLSNLYGEFGLLKKTSFQKTPPIIRVKTRTIFIHLKN